MTALVSCFARAYHFKNSKVRVFDDCIAEKLLTKQEYDNISDNMKNGIKYFNPNFTGNCDEALRWIVNNQLGPTTLGRSAYCEEILKTAIEKGVTQYLIFASGYDSFAYRQPDYAKDLQIFEIDRQDVIVDKISRVKNIDGKPDNLEYVICDFTKKDWRKAIENNIKYNKNKVSFCSLLGISYYLTECDFRKMIADISKLVAKGSMLVFDYPCKFDNYKTTKQEELAKAAGEEMKAKYSFCDIEKLLLDNYFEICENLSPIEITEQYFKEYNNANSDLIKAFDNVNYCLSIKKTQ